MEGDRIQITSEEVKEIAKGVVNEFADRLYIRFHDHLDDNQGLTNAVEDARFPDPPKKEPHIGEIKLPIIPIDHEGEKKVDEFLAKKELADKLNPYESNKVPAGNDSITHGDSYPRIKESEFPCTKCDARGMREAIELCLGRVDDTSKCPFDAWTRNPNSTDAKFCKNCDVSFNHNFGIWIDDCHRCRPKAREPEGVGLRSLEMVALRAENSELRREIRGLKDETGRIIRDGIYSNHGLEKENFELRDKLKEREKSQEILREQKEKLEALDSNSV